MNHIENVIPNEANRAMFIRRYAEYHSMSAASAIDVINKAIATGGKTGGIKEFINEYKNNLKKIEVAFSELELYFS